jgi:NMD protein affecting ribosome stability and mRNA decay
LQLRNVNDEILDYVESFVRKNNISIAKKTLIETGYDLDISDQRKLQSLGKNLQKNFGGILKTSIRQFTQNRLTSKQVYRVNVYYESPLFKKGDVLKIDKDLFLVTSISKDISAIDLNRDKKRKIDLKNKEFSILAPEKTTVLKIYPTVEVLDPDTYQAVPLQNKKEVKIGEKVKIVNDNGLFYIV